MLIAGIRIGHIVAGLGIGENSTKYPSIPAGREGFIGTPFGSTRRLKPPRRVRRGENSNRESVRKDLDRAFSLPTNKFHTKRSF